MTIIFLLLFMASVIWWWFFFLFVSDFRKINLRNVLYTIYIVFSSTSHWNVECLECLWWLKKLGYWASHKRILVRFLVLCFYWIPLFLDGKDDFHSKSTENHLIYPKTHISDFIFILFFHWWVKSRSNIPIRETLGNFLYFFGTKYSQANDSWVEITVIRVTNTIFVAIIVILWQNSVISSNDCSYV